jgi:hypothetical protein
MQFMPYEMVVTDFLDTYGWMKAVLSVFNGIVDWRMV